MPTAAHPEPHPPRRLHCPVVDMPFSATSVGSVRGRPAFPEFLARDCECRWAVYFRCIPLLLACCMSLPFRTASPSCLTFQLALPSIQRDLFRIYVFKKSSRSAFTF